MLQWTWVLLMRIPTARNSDHRHKPILITDTLHNLKIYSIFLFPLLEPLCARAFDPLCKWKQWNLIVNCEEAYSNYGDEKNLIEFRKEMLQSWLYILYSSRDRPLLTAVFSCLQISLPTNKMKDAKMKQLKKLEKGFNFIENRCLMSYGLLVHKRLIL